MHISLTGVPSEMLVMFVVLGTARLDGATVRVQFGSDSKDDSSVTVDASSCDDWREFNATAATYTVPSRWWEPDGWLGWVYTAKVEGLEQGQVLEY